MLASTRLWAVLALVLAAPQFASALPPPRTGEVKFEPGDREDKVPEQFRLEAHTFAFEQKFVETSSTKFERSEVTFPSPVETPHPNNNTVHCEFFRPLDEGQRPATIVLHILGGDFELSRLFCRQLAHNGVAALFVKMPYYGPRRQPGVDARMISPDPRQTVAGMRQAILDIRRAVAWLASQETVDPQRLGVFGISLGGITSALAATAEPRLANVCLMLAGGDIARVAWESPEVGPLRERWLAQGGTRETFFDTMRTVDPVTYAENVRGRRILMLNAARDEVIPKQCTESLWHAFGEPDIVWMDAGHYSAVWYLLDGLSRVTRFFKDAP